MKKIKDSFNCPKTVSLKIDNEYQYINDVLAVNCDIPSQSVYKKGLVYVKLSCGFITFDGELKEIKFIGDDDKWQQR